MYNPGSIATQAFQNAEASLRKQAQDHDAACKLFTALSERVSATESKSVATKMTLTALAEHAKAHAEAERILSDLADELTTFALKHGIPVTDYAPSQETAPSQG